MPQATVNGVGLHYEVSGPEDGEPLLLIFGFGGDVNSWALHAPVFNQRYRVITLDNRGVGRTIYPDGEFSCADMAVDVAALLDHLGVNRAHVLGYSMGGQIAQELALLQHDRVRSLMLLATWARGDGLFNAVLDAWGRMPGAGVERELYALNQYTFVFTDAFFSVPGAIDQLLAQASANPYPPAPRGLFLQSRAILNSDTLARLPQITCPTLVLVGREDILSPPKFAEQLAAGLPNARLQVFDHGGHGVLFEAMEEFTGAVLTFLDAQTAPGP